MVLLWLTTIIAGARPPSYVQFHDSCESTSILQLLLLYSAFRPHGCWSWWDKIIFPFGADHLGKRDKLIRAGTLESFFSWYCAMVSVAILEIEVLNYHPRPHMVGLLFILFVNLATRLSHNGLQLLEAKVKVKELNGRISSMVH